MYICYAVIIVCFALFFGVGYDNPVGDYNAPLMTDVVMWLMYIMAVVTAALVAWSVAKGISSNRGGNAENNTGVPGAKITLFSVCLLVVSLVVGYVCGLGEPDFTAADGTVTTGAWVTIVDMFCISIGIMFVVAAAAVMVSMSGILVKSSSK